MTQVLEFIRRFFTFKWSGPGHKVVMANIDAMVALDRNILELQRQISSVSAQLGHLRKGVENLHTDVCKLHDSNYDLNQRINLIAQALNDRGWLSDGDLEEILNGV